MVGKVRQRNFLIPQFLNCLIRSSLPLLHAPCPMPTQICNLKAKIVNPHRVHVCVGDRASGRVQCMDPMVFQY